MGSIKVTNKNKFKKTKTYFNQAYNCANRINFDVYGKRGVEALRDATPVKSGETADSWDYVVTKENGYYKIVWTNSNLVGTDHIPLAILLQYGHASSNGSWVEGLDYINPALKPIFESMANEMWKEAKGR